MKQIRHTYFCTKCKHIHVFGGKIAEEHRRYNAKKEKLLEDF